MNHQSYVVVAPEQVIKWCKATLTEVAAARKEFEEIHLRLRVQQRTRSPLRRFFRFLFRLSPPTAAGVRAELEHLRGHYYDRYHMIRHFWAAQEETAERLFNLAFCCTSDVYLTAADFDHIGTKLHQGNS